MHHCFTFQTLNSTTPIKGYCSILPCVVKVDVAIEGRVFAAFIQRCKNQSFAKFIQCSLLQRLINVVTFIKRWKKLAFAMFFIYCKSIFCNSTLQKPIFCNIFLTITVEIFIFSFFIFYQLMKIDLQNCKWHFVKKFGIA